MQTCLERLLFTIHGGLETVDLEAITDEIKGLTHLLCLGCYDYLQVLNPMQSLLLGEEALPWFYRTDALHANER